MVSFICNACGQTVKKAQVERHYQNDCPSCDVLSCIDCGKDFHGDEYTLHTKCITEAEKYQGKLYRPKDKQNKGEQKQLEWLKNVKEVTKSDTGDPRITNLLERISEYSNIPRKKAKFQNFCKNSINVRDCKTLDKLWDIFSDGTKEPQASDLSNNGIVQHENEKTSTDEKAVKTSEEFKGSTHKNKKGKKAKDCDKSDIEKKSKVKENCDTIEEVDGHEKEKKRKRKRRDNNVEDDGELQFKVSKVLLDEGNTQDQEAEKLKGPFKWKSVIKALLREAPEQELPIKRLRKKVLAEFNARGANDRNLSNNELRSLFENKVSKNPIFKVHKDRVKLVK